MSAKPRHRSRVLVLSVAGVFALAACGDDDDEAGSEGSTPASGEATTASGGGATTSVSSATTTASTGSAPTSVASATTTASTGSAPSGTGVELLDPGAEGQRVRLPGTAEVGQSAASAVRIDVNLAMEGPGVSEEVPFSFRIETETEIVDVTESGYVAETTITGAELEEGPPGVDAAGFAQIEGVTFRQETSAEGVTGDAELVGSGQVTDAQRQAFNQFIGQLKSASIAYPSEPVGLGARWRGETQPVDSQGFSFDITYEYELTSIQGDSYRIDVSYDEGIDDEVEQAGQTGRMRGTVTGSGRTSGSTSNPLLVNTSMTQDFDVDIEADGEQLTMTMDVRVDMESTPG